MPPAHANPLCVMIRTLKSPPMAQTTGLDPRFKLDAFVRLPLGICIWEGKGEGSFYLRSIVSANPFRLSFLIPLRSFLQVQIYSEQPRWPLVASSLSIGPNQPVMRWFEVLHSLGHSVSSSPSPFM